jgi:mannosyltransferase
VNRISRKNLSALWIPTGFFFLNFILKIIFIGRRDISMDEPFTLFYSQADFHKLFGMLQTENNPPLFFVLQHFWIAVFGLSPLAVRFPSLLFSSLTAPVIYQTGKRYFSASVGFVSGLLFTFSEYHLNFSHEARVYALFALLSASSFYLFLRLNESKETKFAWLLSLVNLLLIYSHFFGFIVLAIQFVACFSTGDARRMIRLFLLSTGIVLLGFLPYLPVVLHRFSASAGGTWVPAPVLTDLYTMVWRFSNAPVVTVLFLIVLFSAGLKFLIKRFMNKECISAPSGIILLWFFLPYFLMFLLSFRLPIFLDRYLIFVTPAYYLLVGSAVFYLQGSLKWPGIVVSGICIAAMLLTFNPDYDNGRRLKDCVSGIKELKKSTVPMVICPEWLNLPFSYHYNLNYFKDYNNLKRRLADEKIYSVNSFGTIPSVILNNSDSLILFEEWPEVVDPGNRILKEFSTRYAKCTTLSYPESYKVYLFTDPIRPK